MPAKPACSACVSAGTCCPHCEVPIGCSCLFRTASDGTATCVSCVDAYDTGLAAALTAPNLHPSR